MFSAITKKPELEKLQRAFDRKLRPYITKDCEIIVGHPGGNWEETVHYSSELDIWWILAVESKGKRYWNAFGIGDPSGQHVNIVVEINYPVVDANFYVASNWAKAENGGYFLFHSGKIGGGRKGIGQTAFMEQYTGGGTHIIDVSGYPRKTALIAELNDPNFAYQIRSFVFSVAVFKGLTKQKPEVSVEFSPEFDGTKTYGLPLVVTANANHGLIVNQFKTLLEQRKLTVGNNGKEGRIDLYIKSKSGKFTHLFEVKSALSIQAICGGIGQLFLYSNNISPKPQLVLVCPESLPKKLSDTLIFLGISVITFRLKNGKYIFQDLDLLFK